MTVSREERNRILHMVAGGQVSAEEAGQLLDALWDEEDRALLLPQNRTVRIWVTDTNTHKRKVNLTATLPVDLLRVSLQTLASIVPPLQGGRAEHVIHSLENGINGRIIDLQDLDDGRRVEVFIEH